MAYEFWSNETEVLNKILEYNFRYICASWSLQAFFQITKCMSVFLDIYIIQGRFVLQEAMYLVVYPVLYRRHLLIFRFSPLKSQHCFSQVERGGTRTKEGWRESTERSYFPAVFAEEAGKRGWEIAITNVCPSPEAGAAETCSDPSCFHVCQASASPCRPKWRHHPGWHISPLTGGYSHRT